MFQITYAAKHNGTFIHISAWVGFELIIWYMQLQELVTKSWYQEKLKILVDKIVP